MSLLETCIGDGYEHNFWMGHCRLCGVEGPDVPKFGVEVEAPPDVVRVRYPGVADTATVARRAYEGFWKAKGWMLVDDQEKRGEA